MKIAVLVKEVPDTYGQRRIVLDTGLVDRTTGENVADEIGERALEAALTVREGVPDSTVTVVSMGPAGLQQTLRKLLAMGADSALHITDDGLVGADLTLTAEVLAAALRRLGPDLVLAGNLSTDGTGGVLPAMLAEHLDFAQLSYLATLELAGTTVRGTRVSDAGTGELEAELPAVVSISEALPDPRFPSLKGILAAKKKPIETVSAAELGVDAADEESARSIVIAARERPPRGAGVKIVDEGDGGRRAAEFLIERGLA
jgi:electron transfer flavoprotein beta subunit